MNKTICFVALLFPVICHAGLLTGEPGALQPAPVVIQPDGDDFPSAQDRDSAAHLAEIAVQDLASRLDLSPENITVIHMIPVIWPDASLGCPQKGVAYEQVAAKGFIVTLEANAIRYPYHTNTDQRVVSCENPQLPGFPVKPGEIDDGQPWVPVD